MRPLTSLTSVEASRIDEVVFDLDETFLEEGRLDPLAYASLFRLREAGLTLVACTGRPSGWVELLVRQWPLRAAIAENGAVAWQRQGDRVVLVDSIATSERTDARLRIDGFVAKLAASLPELALADDNAARRTDVTFDIGEHRRVAPEVVARARELAARAGLRTCVSSVHLHVTCDGHDKATGYASLARRSGLDPHRALLRALFVGDSGNDAAAFAAFGTTVGVANVAAHVRALTVPPRYVTSASSSRGFVELAYRLVELRRRATELESPASKEPPA